MRRSAKIYLLCVLAIAPLASAAAITIPLPNSPFGVACTRDAQWVFVSMMGRRANPGGVAVLHQSAGHFSLQRVIPLTGAPGGLVLTHDGRNLIVTAGDSVFILDVRRMIDGSAQPIISTFSDGDGAGSIYVNVTPDDKTLFISDEYAQSICVMNLDSLRANGYDAAAVIGRIPVGRAPIALTFSPDGRRLYTTSEVAPPAWLWPQTLAPEIADPSHPDARVSEGAVVVVDVAKARANPAGSVLARVPAGGSPVRMAISPDGRRIYVTARHSNAVLVFDTDRLITDSAHVRLAMIPVGASPVPLALIQDGRTLVVGNSNRFGADANKAQTLTALDVSHIGASGPATIGTIAAGAFPREMCVSSDGRTLFVTNFGSNSLEIIDAENPPMQGQ